MFAYMKSKKEEKRWLVMRLQSSVHTPLSVGAGIILSNEYCLNKLYSHSSDTFYVLSVSLYIFANIFS